MIRSRTAARSAAVASLRLGTRVTGGRIAAGAAGGLLVLDSRGRQAMDTPTPLQWDSNKTLPIPAHGAHTASGAGKAAADASDADHAGLAARVAPVGVKADGSFVTLAPNAAMAASKATVYPVYVDPTFNWHPDDPAAPAFDEVKQGCPGDSFYNKTGALEDNGYLGVGYNGWQEGQCYTGDEHAVYQWKLGSTLWGATINTATVNATDVYSASCATTATVNLHWSKGMGSGVDWSNRPGYNNYTTSQSYGPAYNPTYCPGNGPVTHGFNVQPVFKLLAGQHATTFTATLSEDSLESSRNDLGLKRFDHNPALEVFFNNPPNNPTAATMAAVAGADDAACSTTAPGPYMGKTIAATPPILRAKVSDPNGDKLQATFQYWLDGSTTKHTGLSGDNLNSGSYANYSLPAAYISSLANGNVVDWDVSVSDGQAATGYAASPTCHFTAEPAAPETPTVTSEGNLYPDTDVTDAVVGAVAGTPGSFDVTGVGTTATKFVYGLDQPPATSSPPAAAVKAAVSNAATLTNITPPSPGPHTLYVYAVDAAGDVSGDFAYPFLAAGHAGTTCASLALCLNNTAISPDSNMALGAADSLSSMSATDLTNAGWKSGAKVTVDGATFALPAYGTGQSDNVLASNQTITEPANTSGSALVFLANSTSTAMSNPGAIDNDSTAPYVPSGTAVSGSYCFTGTTPIGVCPATGTITYSDGTSTPYTLTVPDWVTGPTSLAAVSLPHWNRPSGQLTAAAGRGLKIYPFSVPIDPTKTISSVTLPDVTQSVAGGHQALHIYGISTRNTTTSTTELNTTTNTATTATLPAGQGWTGAWAGANENTNSLDGATFSNQSFRIALKPSISGTNVRIKLDNALGTTPLSIGHATIALGSSPTTLSDTPSGTPTTLKFGTSQTVTIPEGGMVYSDPLPFTVTANQYLLVTFQLTNSVPFLVQHHYANASYEWISPVGSGDKTTDTTGTPWTGTSYGSFTDLVTDLDVTSASANVPTEAVLGDNLTDPPQPNTSPVNSNGYRLSDALSGAEPSTTAPYGVIAEGIEANQLMGDNPEAYNGSIIGGPSALSRIDRDILDQPGINTVIVNEGLEDLLNGTATATDLENNGYQALVQQLQAWGINVVLTSLTPCQGFAGDGATPNDPCTTSIDADRADTNSYLGDMNLGNPWGTPATYFADLDQAIAVPNAINGQERLAPFADTGDHVNISLAANGALANAIMTPQDTWNLDDGTGMPVATDTAATDTPDTPGTVLNANTGNNPLALSATGSTWGDDAARGTVLTLDGASGDAASSTPVLNTAGSFSISAWVRLPSLPTRNETIATQPGTSASAFSLQYNYTRTSSPGWAFAVTDTDSAAPTVSYAAATGAAANTWTHLVGVYNASTHTTQLYVNGTLTGTQTGVTTWNAPGAFTLGSDLTAGTQTDFLAGSLSTVQAYDYAITANQASALYLGNGAGGPYTFADTVDFDGDGHPDLIAKTASGDLWMFPGDGTHGPDTQTPTLIGNSWSTYTIVGIADWNKDGYPDLIAKDAAGTMWLYPGDANHDLATARIQMGTAWASTNAYAGVRDWNGDGKPDIVVRDSAGTLWMYPGNGATSYTTRVQISTGWGTTTYAGMADWNKDGYMDLLARDTSGTLWLYPGDAAHDTTTARVQLGTGWSSYTFAGLTDWNTDTDPDIITRDGTGNLWMYCGNGTTGLNPRIQLGAAW
ncbi:LamG-like jellyroll fold domain-containing protein [Streptacidiphilus sp. N1-3]|uniref:LamG-like jellyroll fold domain-containing protein n=1 Tax=Streptacidiphilus alkalitolerans TaxID=3342712 RepID=A0ABV6X2M1_9ACTN